MKMKRLMFVLVFLLILSVVAAHEEEEHDEVFEDKSTMFKRQALLVIIGAAVIASLLVIIALAFTKKKSNRVKWALFVGIAIPVIFATLYSAGTTIYVNAISSTKGPVHWHADFEIWNCGESIDLIDPTGVSNRLGSAVFHEHGDNRIHVEGVVIDPGDVALHHFFEFVGGDMTNERLLVPTNEGFVVAQNGEVCKGQPGKLQMFVYSVINPEDRGDWVYEQHKIEDFVGYVLAPHPIVPPGDCFIIEFDVEKERTDKLCGSYQLAIERGELSGG